MWVHWLISNVKAAPFWKRRDAAQDKASKFLHNKQSSRPLVNVCRRACANLPYHTSNILQPFQSITLHLCLTTISVIEETQVKTVHPLLEMIEQWLLFVHLATSFSKETSYIYLVSHTLVESFLFCGYRERAPWMSRSILLEFPGFGDDPKVYIDWWSGIWESRIREYLNYDSSILHSICHDESLKAYLLAFCVGLHRLSVDSKLLA